MPTKVKTIAFIRKNKDDVKIKAPTSKSVSVLNSEVEKAIANAPASVKEEWSKLKAEDKAFGEQFKAKVPATAKAGGIMEQKIKEKAKAKLKAELLKKKSSSAPARPPRTATTGTQTGSSAPSRPARGRTNPPANRSKPTPLPRDAPVKKLPASYFGPKVGSRPPKKMSEQHKAKIRAGVKKYHAGCVGGKGKKQQVANLRAEVSKLKGMLDK